MKVYALRISDTTGPAIQSAPDRYHSWILFLVGMFDLVYKAVPEVRMFLRFEEKIVDLLYGSMKHQNI